MPEGRLIFGQWQWRLVYVFFAAWSGHCTCLLLPSHPTLLDIQHILAAMRGRIYSCRFVNACNEVTDINELKCTTTMLPNYFQLATHFWRQYFVGPTVKDSGATTTKNWYMRKELNCNNARHLTWACLADTMWSNLRKNQLNFKKLFS